MPRGWTTTAAGLIATLLAACASAPPDPETEARQYRRDDARIQATENFHEQKRKCRARGGIMLLPRSNSRVPPTASELRLASCEHAAFR